MATEYLQKLAALANAGRFDEAAALSEEAVNRYPEDERVLRARAIVLRRSSQRGGAHAFLQEVVGRRPRAAWAHAQLGLVWQGNDTRRAIESFRAAFDLEPHVLDYRLGLIHNLARWGGNDEGDALEEAYQLLRPVLGQAGGWPANNLYIALQVLQRVCAYDELDRLGARRALGRRFAEAGDHTALLLTLSHIPQVTEDEAERLYRQTLVEGSSGADCLTE